MSDGRCPKCNAASVHIVDAANLSIPVSTFSAAPLGFYVCVQCGYAELFVRDRELLPKIAAKYISVAELKEIGP